MNIKAPTYEEFYLYHLHMLNIQLGNSGVESDRTGTGTSRMFGTQIRCDLRTDFPLLTTKKVFTRGIIEELLWILRGESNIGSLVEKDVHIWDSWATSEGELGPVYGAMWRYWPDDADTIDQIAGLIQELKINPNSRRMIVSAWNPALLPDTRHDPVTNAEMGLQALPPCHTMWQCFSQEMSTTEQEENSGFTRWLDLQLYQRSADWMLGVPFNAVSYSLLQMLLAHHVGMKPRHFIHTFGDYHLYGNHQAQADEQCSRELVKERPYVELLHDSDKPLDQLEASDIKIHNYHPHPAIKAPVSV